MDAFVTILLIEGLVFGVLLILFWLIVMRAVQKDRSGRKDPFTKSLLNNPGESSWKKLTELEDSFSDDYGILLAVAAGTIGYILGVLFPVQGKVPPVLITISILALGIAVYLMFRIRRNILERRKYRLGFEGERHTAQAIAPLIRDGYSIFHDFPGKKADGTLFNIDHVLVGPAGVIIVETKARSKTSELRGRDVAVLQYDGQKIQFPGWTETNCLDQAKAGAKYLGGELTRETGERVRVRAVVCLPGWFVPHGQTFDPHVCNPGMLLAWVRSLPPTALDAKQLNRVRGYVEKLVTIQRE